MSATLLADVQFHELLLAIDRDLADACRAGGCEHCGGVLHSARYPRKPRGRPKAVARRLGRDHDLRFNFCCAVDGCRSRDTPPSVRFLGRRVYLAAIVVLPRLLILDPFVRLHRIDENASGEVAPLLAFLRELQRRHGTAVLVVHHARKGGSSVRAGQALRGSSDFHAWGDSNHYLRRDGDALSLTVEHRAAPSPKPLDLDLAQRGLALALEVTTRTEPAAAPTPSIDDRILAALADADTAIPFATLREHCRIRTATLRERIATLTATGRIVKTDGGWRPTDL